jgi:hypothetical protein
MHSHLEKSGRKERCRRLQLAVLETENQPVASTIPSRRDREASSDPFCEQRQAMLSQILRGFENLHYAIKSPTSKVSPPKLARTAQKLTITQHHHSRSATFEVEKHFSQPSPILPEGQSSEGTVQWQNCPPGMTVHVDF